MTSANARPRERRRATDLDVMRFSLALAPGHLIRRAQQLHTELWSSVVGDDLTSPQFAVLLTLHQQPLIDQTKLSRLASLDTSTCQDIVTRLYRKGLVVRGRDPSDGRRWSLQLTPEGNRVLRDALPKAEEVGVRLVESLNERGRHELRRMLTQIAKIPPEDAAAG